MYICLWRAKYVFNNKNVYERERAFSFALQSISPSSILFYFHLSLFMIQRLDIFDKISNRIQKFFPRGLLRFSNILGARDFIGDKSQLPVINDKINIRTYRRRGIIIINFGIIMFIHSAFIGTVRKMNRVVSFLQVALSRYSFTVTLIKLYVFSTGNIYVYTAKNTQRRRASYRQSK